jgi:membrane-associated phospholipid phosphatase
MVARRDGTAMKAASAAALLAVAVAAWPGVVRAGDTSGDTAGDTAQAPPARLGVDLRLAGVTTGGLLLLDGASVLLQRQLVAPSCRWCSPGRLDRWARRELRWADVKGAGTGSDLLVVAVPAGATLALGLWAFRDGVERREVAEDLLTMAEAVSAALLLTQVAKYGASRLRPDAWAAGGPSTLDGRMSFWSGHTAFAFSAAAAATQVARLRGRPRWRWLALASFAGAAATGWLRIAADRHWLSDVVTGAVVGTVAGLGVPLLVLQPEGSGRPVSLALAPGGLALTF